MTLTRKSWLFPIFWLVSRCLAPRSRFVCRTDVRLNSPIHKRHGGSHRPERVETEKPRNSWRSGIKKGTLSRTSAQDQGSFAPRCPARGTDGGSFAADVEPEMIDGLRRMAQKSGLENIVPILGSAG